MTFENLEKCMKKENILGVLYLPLSKTNPTIASVEVQIWIKSNDHKNYLSAANFSHVLQRKKSAIFNWSGEYVTPESPTGLPVKCPVVLPNKPYSCTIS